MHKQRSKQIKRIIDVLNLLEREPESWNRHQLATRFRCNTATISRDIQIIREMGIRIEASGNRGYGGYIVSRMNFPALPQYLYPERNRGSARPDAKLDEAGVLIIKRALAKGKSYAEISRLFDVSRAAIRQIDKNITWKHVKEKK